MAAPAPAPPKDDRQQDGDHDSAPLSDREQAIFDQMRSEYDDEAKQGQAETTEQQQAGGRLRTPSHESSNGFERSRGDKNANSFKGGGSPPGNKGAIPKTNQSITPGGLKAAEEGAGGGWKTSLGDRGKSLAANGMLGAAEKQGADSPFQYSGGGGAKGGLRGLLKKHNKKLIAGSLAGVGLLPILALLLFIAGSLKLPHFMENVAAWRFAKITRQYRKNIQNISGEKAALDSLDDQGKERARGLYGKYPMFDKVQRLRPNKVLQGLQTHDRLQYNYRTTLTGKQKLVSITIAPGEDVSRKITVRVPSGRFDRLIHPLRTLDQYRTVSAALNMAMRAHDPKVSTVVRAAATKAVIRKAGGSLKGLVASRYLGQENSTALQQLAAQLDAAEKEFNSIIDESQRLKERSLEVHQGREAASNKIRDLMAQETAIKAEAQQIFQAGGDDYLDKLDDLLDRLIEIKAELDVVNAEYANLRNESDAILNKMRENQQRITSLIEEQALLRDRYAQAGGVLSDRDAKIALQQDVYEQVKDSGGIAAASTENLKNAAEDADEAERKCVADTKCLGDSVDRGGGVPETVNDVLHRSFDPGSAKAIASKVVGFANPLYDIAVPVCMVYDGSKLSSEGIDSQSNATQREALLMLAVGDQQKNGVEYPTPMANAVNWKLGDIQNSMAMRRTNGKPADTTQGTGGQRTILGTYGQYTIFDVMMGPGNHPFNDWADTACPVLSNFWVGVTLGIANIAFMIAGTIFTGGAAPAAETAAAQAATRAAEKALAAYVKRMITSFTIKKGIRAFANGGRFAKQYATDVVKWGAATAGATFLARMIVASQAGTLNSGLETSSAFADNIDNGADQLSGNMMRANYYARPCTNAEIVQMHKQDRAELSMYNESLGTFDRYFALSNPNSLVSRTAITTGSLLERSSVATAINSVANLFNPFNLSSRLLASSNSDAVLAAGNVNTEDYGNIQWCYPPAELQRMDQDSYASPSENARILTDSGQAGEIEARYNHCFTDTVGTLLEGGHITRDEDGDILNEGNCSPLQLGMYNPDYGDLVFRWRIDKGYNNTTDLMLGIQDPAKPGTTLQTSISTGAIPTGTAQQLATQILNHPNIKFQVEPAQRQAVEHIAQTGYATQTCPDSGGPPPVDPRLLGVILALAQKYKITVGVLVDGHSCNEGYHPRGMAVDFNGVERIDGGPGAIPGRIPGNNGDNSTRFVLTTAQNGLLKEFYADAGKLLSSLGGGGMGQETCFENGPPYFAPGVDYFPDTCHHIHLDVRK